jgi:hypothetical protein
MQNLGDPSQPTVWQGRKLSLIGTVAGGRVPTTRYRITPTRLYWTIGRLGTKTQDVPLWAVRDAVVSQSLTQRARRVGSITVSLQHPAYTGTPTFVLLEDIEKPHEVVGLLSGAAQVARSAHDAQ